MARYTKDENGNLILTAGGTRTWIVTQAAHDRAVSAGTAPNNCLVAITDDYPTEDVSGELVLASGVTVSSGGFTRFEQNGNVVVFSFHGLTVTPTGAGDWTLLGTLPSNIGKPRSNLYFSDGNGAQNHIIQINTSGQVFLYSPSVTTQQQMNAGNATYIAD